VDVPEDKLEELKQLFSEQQKKKVSREEYVKITLEDGSVAEIPKSAWEKVRRRQESEDKQLETEKEDDGFQAFLRKVRSQSDLEGIL